MTSAFVASPPAPFGSRCVAALIDLILVSVAVSIVCWPVLAFTHLETKLRSAQAALAGLQAQAMNEGPVDADPELMQTLMSILVVSIVLLVVISVLTHLYYVAFEASPNGQTPGKKLLGLRVVNLDGGQITRRQAVIRELGRWYVDVLFLPVALISMMLSVRRQRVGDRWAGTQVVQVSSRPSSVIK